jgi:hypothetical protein
MSGLKRVLEYNTCTDFIKAKNLLDDIGETYLFGVGILGCAHCCSLLRIFDEASNHTLSSGDIHCPKIIWITIKSKRELLKLPVRLLTVPSIFGVKSGKIISGWSGVYPSTQLETQIALVLDILKEFRNS